MLQLVETIRAEEASVQRLFGGEGVGVRSHTRRQHPEYARNLAEAASLIADVFSGRQRSWKLQEALTTSDFPLLFGDTIDRMVLANYREAPSVYRNFCKIATVPDFRTVKRFAINGSEAVLDPVAQQAPYPESSLSEARYQYSVSKYGRRIPFAWETMINDDLQALQDIPQRFGRAARRTESKLATQLYADASGPHASLYTSGNKNIVNATNAGGAFTANNPPLTIPAMNQALTVLLNQVDADNEPITIDAVWLVVPAALKVTAMQIVGATEIWWTDAFGGGTTTAQVHGQNYIQGLVKMVEEPYLPTVSTTNGQTSWYLFADPNVGRPALEVGFLRGHTEPELFMKSPNATRIGGGAVDPMDGDFENDSIEYKIRHVVGGVRLDPKMTVASNGTGS